MLLFVQSNNNSTFATPKMENIRFTHLAKIYGFHCLFNDQTMEIKGTNWFNDFMIDVFIWAESIIAINDDFIIQIIEPIKKRNYNKQG